MIVIATDKFKGSLTSREAAEAIAAGFRQAGCTKDIKICEMSDGGEGLPAEIAGNPTLAVSDHVGKSNIGLCKLPLEERSSYCLGEYLNKHYSDVADADFKLWIGVGGTMIADAGMGMLQALGAKFYDCQGSEIKAVVRPIDIPNIGSIDISECDVEYWRKRLHVLSDVKASLSGPELSAIDFIKQKGAKESDFDFFRGIFAHLKDILAIEKVSEIDGAGGGLGFAFSTIMGVPYSLGAEAVLAQHNINWRDVTLLVSGEGCIDNQTLGGKVVKSLGEKARMENIPFVAFGGYASEEMRCDTKQYTIVSTIPNKEEYDEQMAAERLKTAAVAYADRWL